MQINSFKHLLLLSVALFLGNVVFAQDWHPFPDQQTFVYSYDEYNDDYEWLFAARFDSVKAEGLDSAYYFYKVDRYVNIDDSLVSCPTNFGYNPRYAYQRDHFFGEKMLWRPDGLCRFVSSLGDTFLLDSKASLASSWTFQPGITATVDSLKWDLVLGQSDSLKYISLSDGRKMVLSKSHGFVETFNFLTFQRDVLSSSVKFKLSSMQQNGFGEVPTFSEIFSFDPGDKFCYYYHYHNSNPGSYGYEHYTIIAQIPSPNLKYVVLHEKLNYGFAGYNIGYIPTYTPAYIDTIQFDSSSYLNFGLLPFEHNPGIIREYWGVPYPAQVGCYKDSLMESRPTLIFEQPSYIDSCNYAGMMSEQFERWRYGKGLGLVRNYSIDSQSYYTKELYFYNKGGVTWGTYINLSALVALDDFSKDDFSISPNPAQDMVRIQCAPNWSGEIKLVALDGRILNQWKVSSSEEAIECSVNEFPAGIYMVKFSGEGDKAGHVKRLVIQR